MAIEDEKETFRKGLSPTVWVLTLLWSLLGWGLLEGFEQAGYIGPINSGFRLAAVVGIFLTALWVTAWRADCAVKRRFKDKS
jgi:hypothetical protein